MPRFLTLVVATLFPFTAAAAWRVEVGAPNGDHNEGAAVRVDAAGDVIAAGRIEVFAGLTVVKLAGSDGHQLWAYATSNEADGLALDAAGNAYACGNDAAGWVVAKIAGADGAEVWRVGVPQTHFTDEARTIAVDAAGNPFVVGRLDGVFTVLALAAADGSERWRNQVPGNEGEAIGVAVDGAGDVVVVGGFVVKFAGADGATKWTYAGNGIGSIDAGAVAVDGNGDVAAAGFILDPVTETDFAVAKVAGADGSELWRRAIDGRRSSDWANAVVFAAGGDVVAGGRVDRNTGVRRFNGSDGTDVWVGRRTHGTVRALALDGDGNVLATGTNPQLDNAFLVMKYAAADGRRLWRRTIRGTARGDATGRDVVADAAGNVIATGSTHQRPGAGPSSNFTVVQLDPLTGRSE